MAGPINRGQGTNPNAKGGGGMDPVTIGLTAAGGISNLLGGNAQRKAQQKQFDAQRNDAQRAFGQDAAQFAAKLGFDKDNARYDRSKDVYSVQRDREADDYKRQQTNALNPARRDLIGALMARFVGGQGGDWSKMFASQPGVSSRPNYGGVEEAAAKEFTTVANPLQAEQQRATSQVEQEARKRAEEQIAVKMAQFQKGERDPKKYAVQLGFDPFDPNNRDKWIQAFMDEDAEYKKLSNNVAGQYGRMGAGINY